MHRWTPPTYPVKALCFEVVGLHPGAQSGDRFAVTWSAARELLHAQDRRRGSRRLDGGESRGGRSIWRPCSTPMAQQSAAVAALTSQHNDEHFSTAGVRLSGPLLQQDSNGDAGRNAVPPFLDRARQRRGSRHRDPAARRRPAGVRHHYSIWSRRFPPPTGPEPRPATSRTFDERSKTTIRLRRGRL